MLKFKIEDHTKIIHNCLDNSFSWVTNPLLKEYFLNEKYPPRPIIFESLLSLDTIDVKTRMLIKNAIIQQIEINNKIKNFKNNKGVPNIQIKNPKLF